MTEELPRFVYLYCGLCAGWLAMFGLPSRVTPKLTDAGVHSGWTPHADGTWHCDKHTQEQP